VHELIPVGPLQVKLRSPGDVKARRARLLVAGKTVPITHAGGLRQIQLQALYDHELVVFG
jgi:hypothetical protein